MTTDNDRNVLEEVLERGKIRVSVGDAEADLGFDGFYLDLSRALGAAVFGDPNAIELVEEEFPDSLDSVANGVVDVSAQGTIPNLARDASRGLDFSPVNFVAEQKILVPDDSGIDSLAELSGLTVGASSEANNQILVNALSQAGVSDFETIVFNSTADLYAAYDSGEIDALFDGQLSIVSEIPNLSDPDNQRILDDVVARTTSTLVVDENQSAWADVVNWVTYTLIQAEEFGITSENVHEFLNSENPAIRQFLGLEGNLGEALGLSNDFTVNVIKAVGNYEEVYQRNFDENAIPRGLNSLADDGGIFLSNPFAGVVPSEIDLIDNDDRNVLEEVLERGKILVSVGDAEADSGLNGFNLDLSRALGAAVFGDPNAIKLVEQDFPDSLDSVANGLVDVSAQGTIPNLARDASRGLDFSPVNLVSELKVLVPDDSGIESLADLSGLTVGTTSEANKQSLDNALSQAGVSGVEIIAFNTTGGDLFAAYDAGQVDALFGAQVLIAPEIPNLSDPDNQRFLDDAIARVPVTLAVDENQSAWADVVNWVTYTLIQAEEFGITSENVDNFLTSDDPAIRQFLGLEGNLGEALGLSNDFTVNVIKAVGNYEEVYQRNFDEDLLPRGLNSLADDGGILLSNPFAGVVIDPATDLNPSNSMSFELDDVLVPARKAVADVTVSIDYITGLDASEFVLVEGIADFVEDYLATEPGEGDLYEVIAENLAESLVSDTNLGIGLVSDSLTVELDVEPNSDIPFPFTATSNSTVSE